MDTQRAGALTSCMISAATPLPVTPHLRATPSPGHQRPTSDHGLLAAWRDGDLDAGALLFERHYASVARFFGSKVSRDCEDLIQATFLACLEGIDRFRGESSFRTLLFAIARNKLCRYLREQQREIRRRRPAPPAIAANEPSTTSLLAARSERQHLLGALRHLDLESQMMLELHYWEAMTVRDIAAVLELPVNTVKTRMRRARLRLAQALEADGGMPAS